ncbi:MAG: type IV pilus biogenesis protein PilM [Porticoccaceae bacterium]
MQINWQQWLPNRARTLICVDLSATHLTLVRVAQARSGILEVSGFYHQPLALGAIVERQIVEFDQVAEQLRSAVEQLGGPGQLGAIAVPTATAISKRLELPTEFTESQLEELFGFEIEQHIPYPADEICWDFQRAELSDGSLSPVQLVACRKEYVATREALLVAAGLSPLLIDVESFALQRGFSLLAPQLPQAADVVALIEIGEQSLTLSVLLRGEFLYNREKPIEIGASSEQLIEQISRELQFFYASSPYNFVDLLLLTGFQARRTGLVERLSEVTELRCAVAEPLLEVATISGLECQQLREKSCGLLVALGLAVGSSKW